MMEYEEWRADIIKYFIKQIDIWIKNFGKGKIEEIKIFIKMDASSYIGMELLENGIWYQLFYPNYKWQIEYLENVSYQIKDEIRDSCFLDELWIYFCDEASDEKRDQMIKEVVAELEKKYNCKVTPINERIQLNLQNES